MEFNLIENRWHNYFVSQNSGNKAILTYIPPRHLISENNSNKAPFFPPTRFPYNLSAGFINHLGLSVWHPDIFQVLPPPLPTFQGDIRQKSTHKTFLFNDIWRLWEVIHPEMDWKVIVDDKFVHPLGSLFLHFKTAVRILRSTNVFIIIRSTKTGDKNFPQ